MTSILISILKYKHTEIDIHAYYDNLLYKKCKIQNERAVRTVRAVPLLILPILFQHLKSLI